jgi:ketosteroid isomerase-like protein
MSSSASAARPSSSRAAQGASRAAAFKAAILARMSQENVELAQRSVEAVNRRDLDGLLALMDEDVESVSRIAAMEGGLHGLEGVHRWWESWFGAFPDYVIEVDEVRDREDLVFMAIRAQGHGAGSRVPFEDAVWHASRWRGGKCVWWRICVTWAEAVEAADDWAPKS